MADEQDTRALSDVLDQLVEAGDDERVTVGEINEAFGDRSLAPILLVPALITASPLSGVPGMPTLTGLIVGLIVVQMLMGRNTLWLPGFIARRGVSKARMKKAVAFLRCPVGGVERLLKPRLTWLTERPWNYAALLTCLGIALITPALEFLPFVISIAAVAIGMFAAGILVRDGLLMLVGYAVVGATVWLALFFI
jgi:hypothetical protein